MNFLRNIGNLPGRIFGGRGQRDGYQLLTQVDEGERRVGIEVALIGESGRVLGLQERLVEDGSGQDLYMELIEREEVAQRRTAYNRWGCAAIKVKEYEKAEVYFRRAVELNPGDRTMLNNLGCCLLYLKKYEEGEVFLRQAVKLAPEDARVLDNLGISLYKQAKLLGAEGFWRQALAIDPERYQPNKMLGKMLYHQGRYEEALEYLDKTRELNPVSKSAGGRARRIRRHLVKSE